MARLNLIQPAAWRHILPSAGLAVLATVVGNIKLEGESEIASTDGVMWAAKLLLPALWMGACVLYMFPLSFNRLPITDREFFGPYTYRLLQRYGHLFVVGIFFGRSLMLGAMETALMLFTANGIVGISPSTFRVFAMIGPVPLAVVHTFVEWKRLLRDGVRVREPSALKKRKNSG